MMHVVLFEPEIPQNTGNIARTCVMTGSALHLIGRPGFSLEDRYLRRAGLDYWPYLSFYQHRDFTEFFRASSGGNFYFFTTKAHSFYTQVSYQAGDFLIFGKETAGLPPKILADWQEFAIRIPMVEEIPRSLNLSNTVAIVLYEALRQQGFPGMK